MNIASYQINGTTGIIIDKYVMGGYIGGRSLATRGKKRKGEEDRGGGKGAAQMPGFPVQYTETRANTTIRMSEEIVK